MTARLLVVIICLLCAWSRPAEAAADPVLAAAGDIACPPGSTSTPSSCQQAATSNLVLSDTPTAVAVLGDNQYQSGTLAEFNGAGAFNDTWGREKPIIDPTPGNHEYDLSSTAAGYFSYFGSAAGPSNAGYYSYDLGPWHLISLNSNCSDASGCLNSAQGGVTSAETNWLQADLAVHPARCILAYWHHPLFTSTAGLASPAVQPLWNALYSAGADVVLNGHAHNYERFAQQDPRGAATGAGLREFIVGTGGDDFFRFGSTAPNSQFRDAQDFGIMLLTLHPHSYDWSFKRLDGTVLDSGSTQCHAQPLVSELGAFPAAFAAESTGPSARTAKKRHRGTTVRFRLNAAARVRFTVTKQAPGRSVKRGKKRVCVKPTRRNRKHKRCKRRVTLNGSFTINGVAGKNRFHFTGRLKGKKLPPGRYRLVATPIVGGHAGKSTSTVIRIVR